MDRPQSPDRLTSEILDTIEYLSPEQKLLFELLLDIRAELRQIRIKQGEIKWSSKL